MRASRLSYRGYPQENSRLAGDLIFTVGDIECSVGIWQPKDRVDHVPTREEIEREKKYGWGPSRHDYVPSNRLRMAIDTNSRYSSKQTWTDTKTLPLQLRLPDVMMSFERWAVVDAERKEAERRAAIEKREREAREDALAREAYIQHALGDRLVADAKKWELTHRLQRYLQEMANRVDQITDADDRAAAAEWLTWCQEYAATRDPFAKPIRQPTVKEPGHSEIQEFRKRLGFRTGLW